MSPLIPAFTASFCGSLIIVWVYSRLYSLDNQSYIRIWFYAWTLLPVRYGLLIVAGINGDSAAVIGLDEGLGLLLALLLLWGTYRVSDRGFPRRWALLMGAAFVWVLVASVAGLPALAISVPVSVTLGVTQIYTGTILLRSVLFDSQSRKLAGWAFILLGLHQLDFPLLRPVEWFAPWGFVIAVMLQIFIALSLLLMYFECTRAELEASQNRMALDVAERKRAQAAEHQQRILAEALRDTVGALSSTLDPQIVLNRILERIADLIPHDAATIMMIEGNEARIVGSRGYAERGLAESVSRLPFSLTGSFKFRRMSETGEPVIIGDTSQDDQWTVYPETDWIRAYLGAPIQVDGQTLGFINLDSEVPYTFRPEDAETLRIFADQAGIALRNARLYGAVVHQAVELEQRVAERTAELEQQRAQLQAILDAMGEGVIGMIFGDKPGEVAYRYTNRALHSLTGFNADEWDPKTVFVGSLKPDDFIAAWNQMMQAVNREGIWKIETRARRKDGSEFDAALTVTRVIGPDGRTEGIVSILRDISQQKALEAQKANFVTRASHELRTPITNLMTRLYLARRQPERMETHLDILEEVANRMKNLVEDLLDLSRFERGVVQLKRQPVMLQDLVSHLVKIQQPEAEQKTIELTCDLSKPPLRVSADPERLIQVITNLIINAIHHTPPQGKITVRVEADGDRYALIHVQDTGRGISPEHLPHIFEPFYRASSDGTGIGLGLSISREIVELHGGQLSVTSEPGQGTCFTIKLSLLE